MIEPSSPTRDLSEIASDDVIELMAIVRRVVASRVDDRDVVDEIVQETLARRSEERRVGKECSVTCRSRWSPYH